ncbi:MAG: FecR domain-containing protein, partial [Prevotella sp.]|nr:FecR domain-containing protein [Prevotella sp.]
ITTDEYIEIKTNPGMITQLTLPDSSKVWLNSESSLKYPLKFTGETREVTLNGEAYFKVEKDLKHKFIVSTANNIRIEVLGTEFNVEAYSKNEDVITTLVNGKIGLSYLSAENDVRHLLMTPNQKSVYNTLNRTAVTTSVDVESDIAWIDGKIIFNNTSLENALKILSKRFNVDFIIKNPKLKDYSFSGTFEHQRLDRILEYFKISSNIKSRYITTYNNTNKVDKSIIEIY